jgi:hypothetical protein
MPDDSLNYNLVDSPLKNATADDPAFLKKR